MSGDWLVIVALALTITFIAAAPLNARGGAIYAAIQSRVTRFQTSTPLPEDAPIDPGNARIGIIGMRRVGTGAYDSLRARYGDVIIGVDADPDIVERHNNEGRNVILADPTDDEFWERAENGKVNVVLLAKPEIEQNLAVARHIQQRRRGFRPSARSGAISRGNRSPQGSWRGCGLECICRGWRWFRQRGHQASRK